MNETVSGGGPQADGIRELVERCRSMESELSEIKDRLAAMQRLLEQELRKSGGPDSSSKGDKRLSS